MEWKSKKIHFHEAMDQIYGMAREDESMIEVNWTCCFPEHPRGTITHLCKQPEEEPPACSCRPTENRKLQYILSLRHLLILSVPKMRRSI